MASIVVGVAIIVSAEVERILRSEDAGVGIEVVREKTSVGDVIQGVAPGVTRLHLQRVRYVPGEFHGESVVIRDAGVRSLGNYRETRIQRSSWQTHKRSYRRARRRAQRAQT